MRDGNREQERDAGGTHADHDQGAALEGDSGFPRVRGAEDREAAALLLAPDQRAADRDRGGLPPSGGAPHTRKRFRFDGKGAESGRQSRAGRGAGEAGARPEAAKGANEGPQEGRPDRAQGRDSRPVPGSTEPEAPERRDRSRPTQTAHPHGGGGRAPLAPGPAPRAGLLGGGRGSNANRLSAGGWAGSSA